MDKESKDKPKQKRTCSYNICYLGLNDAGICQNVEVSLVMKDGEEVCSGSIKP